MWPREADIWRTLGSARHFATGDLAQAAPAYGKAARLLEEARQVNAHNPHTLIGLADCYAMPLRNADARALLAEAMTHKPESDDLRVAATAYEQLGDREAALRLVKAALDAGLPLSGIEMNRSLDALRQDPRYRAIARDVAGRQDGTNR